MRELNSYLCFSFSLSVFQSRKSSSECVNLVGTLSVRWISKTFEGERSGRLVFRRSEVCRYRKNSLFHLPSSRNDYRMGML